jgi:hypothetical protein
VRRAPRLDTDGVDLLSKFLPYEAKRRIPARAAMKHPYFDSLGPAVQSLGDSKLFWNFAALKKWGRVFNCLLSLQLNPSSPYPAFT